MSWWSLGRRSTLERRWTFEAGGTIWRMIPLASGKIVGEVRRQEEKRASFFCLDESTGQHEWKEREFDEPWWIGIEAAAYGILILHTYEKPDLPRHKAVIAVDAQTGRELWRMSEAAFWFLTTTHVYATTARIDATHVLEIDLISGAIVRSFGEDAPELVEARRAAVDHIQTGEIVLPAPFVRGSDPSLDERLRRAGVDLDMATGVESLKHDDYLLVSSFAPQGVTGGSTAFDNQLQVLDLATGRLLHREFLARSVPAPVPDTFYVRGATVVSIKDLSILRAHNLPQRDTGYVKGIRRED